MGVNMKFRNLTPNTHVDLKYYRDALDHVFSSDELRNVALSGAYGSGKSSIIRSYENIHQERTFIHISLAHFDEQGKGTTSHSASSEPSKIVNDLEGKILNQLIHQIPVKSIPRYFPIQNKASKRKNFTATAGILMFSVLCMYVFWFSKWASAINALNVGPIKAFLLHTTNPSWRLVGVFMLLLLFSIGLFLFFDIHGFQRIFKKIDLKGMVGIELFASEDDAYFDKYLDKVLTLFDQADADAIVFEDLDRYDVTLIFEKLREINDLAYSRTKQGLRFGKKPLRFFYLIRDDVFTTADRSKFFDFIIPVVPYVDASNSCDQLLEQFDAVGFGSTFQKRFLQDVSLYLSDMRILSNIVNEYIIYHGRLSNSGLTTQPDRQLAMVIYKNLYPGDFDLLRHGRGYVFALFENKRTLLENLRKQIDVKIDQLRQELSTFEQEQLKNIDELNALFFPLLEEVVSINGTSINDLSRTNLIKQILQYPDNVSCRIRTYSQRLDVANRKASMEANPEYVRRKKILENREKNSQKIQSEILALERKKPKLATLNLQELLSQLDGETEESFWLPPLPCYEAEGYIQKIQNSKNFLLLKYLIRNGYIDENYAAYISYFYPNSLTVQDRNFLLALSNRTPLDYDYHLDQPDAVLDRLDTSDFVRKELRNFDLLAYLLHNTIDKELQAWFRACDGNNEAYQFLIQFWRIGRERSHFITAISAYQPTWFRTWCESGLLQGSIWQMFALDILYILDCNQLRKINDERWLTDELCADRNFLMIDHPDIQKLIPAFKSLNVQFFSIDYRKEIDVPLVQAVCRENLYILNFSMLRTFMEIYWDISDKEIESRSYSHILDMPECPLSQRVIENIETYAAVILHENSARFNDDESAVINFLNCEELADEFKIEYIQRMDTAIDDINSIESRNLWFELIKQYRLNYTWENIADYFASLSMDTDGLTPELASFIDSSTKALHWNFSALNERIGKEAAIQLRRAVLSNTAISLERYKSALSSMTFKYKDFPITNIPNDRMKIVLQLEIVPMTVENVAVIRRNYSQLWNDFVIYTDPGKLLELIESGEIKLSNEELSTLLEDSRITIETALSLVDTSEEAISIDGKSYPPLVKAKIIGKCFDPDEASILLQSFGQEDSQVCAAFLQYAKDHADLIAATSESIRHIPIEVYAICLNDFTVLQAESLRSYLPNENFEIVCTKNKKPKFPDTTENRKILNYFMNQHWISSYKIQDGFIRVYPTSK